MSSPILIVKALTFLSGFGGGMCSSVSTAMHEMQIHVTVLQCLLVPTRVVLFIAVTGHSQKTSLVLPTETQEIHVLHIEAKFCFPTDLYALISF